MTEDKFTWVPFAEELLDKICNTSSPRDLYREFKKFPGMDWSDIDQIDPLSYIACVFAGPTKIKERGEIAKNSFNLSNSVPTDMKGCPSFTMGNYMYFKEIYSNGYGEERKSIEEKENILSTVINTLWSFAKDLNNSNLNPELFDKIINFADVRVGKLSQILYICKPNNYYPCDSTTLSYLGVGIENTYESFIEKQRQCAAMSLKSYELSLEAWNYANKRKEFFKYIEEIAKSLPSYANYIKTKVLNEKFERFIQELTNEKLYYINDNTSLNKLKFQLAAKEEWIIYNKNNSNGIPNAILNTHYRNFINDLKNIDFSENIIDNGEKTMQNIEIPKNQILYGPPGTGKTYNTVIEAIKILNKSLFDDYKANIKSYEDLENEFNRLKQSGQIEFVTFHQSYSYEEFVEGIKPNVDSESLKYILQDGLFKEICSRSKGVHVNTTSNNSYDFSKTRVFKMSLGNTLDKDNDIYSFCIENNYLALGWGGDNDFSNCTNLEEIKALYQKDDWGSYAIDRFKNLMRTGDIVIISNGNHNFRAIAEITGEYEYKMSSEIDYHHYRSVKWLYVGDDIPVSRIYDKTFSQASIYAYYYDKNYGKPDYNGLLKVDVLNDIITGNINKTETPPHVLIIDEINRGNISKIFGELITLIEEDKRENLTVKLPYSQEEFTVPKNLYILGTMNTSDRSIASVDIALRRRFVFKEMMPNSELVSDFGCNFKKCFEVLNERISILLDRDHQIGHSYFINDKYANSDINTLENIWFDSIIPLLNEYFYGDWEKLQAILGEAKDDNTSFIKLKKVDIDSFAAKVDFCDDKSFDFNYNCNFAYAMKKAFGNNFNGVTND